MMLEVTLRPPAVLRICKYSFWKVLQQNLLQFTTQRRLLKATISKATIHFLDHKRRVALVKVEEFICQLLMLSSPKTFCV
jgi:hypothetical protein